MLKERSRARPSGGVLLGTRSGCAMGMPPPPGALATGRSPGLGTASRGTGRSPGLGAASRGTGKSPGLGADSRATGRSPGLGAVSREIGRSPGLGADSRATGRSPGLGAVSREIGRSPGLGADSRATGRSPGFGIASRGAGRSPGLGDSSRETGKSGDDGRAGGLTRKVVLQNRQTWSRPAGGISATTCCPLKHFGQMTLSEDTAEPFAADCNIPRDLARGGSALRRQTVGDALLVAGLVELHQGQEEGHDERPVEQAGHAETDDSSQQAEEHQQVVHAHG
jgi:hypothetical protein